MALREPAALSPRQIDVLRFAAHGLTAKETAHKLGLAYQTVKNCRSAAEQALGALSLAHAVYLLRDVL